MPPAVRAPFPPLKRLEVKGSALKRADTLKLIGNCLEIYDFLAGAAGSLSDPLDFLMNRDGNGMPFCVPGVSFAQFHSLREVDPLQ